MDSNREELIGAYIDDELSASERAEVEKWLAESPELRQLHDELLAMRSSLQTLPQHQLDRDLAPFVLRQAEALADRVCAGEEDAARRVDRAYRLALARAPTAAERERALAFLRDFAALGGAKDAARGAWVMFCQALFAGAEFRYLD